MQSNFGHICWNRWLLLVILGLIVMFNYYGEYCALCDGYGWDGCSYYKGIVENGWEEYQSDTISYYHTHRMLPFLVINGVIRILSLSFSSHHVMLVAGTINVVLLMCSVILFFRISSQMRWKKNTESIAFAFCFFNYHVLKFMGYCPVMTDMPAFFLGWFIAYSFFFAKKGLLALGGILSIFVFPLLSLVAFFLLMFDRKVGAYQKNKVDDGYHAIISLIYMLWLPLAFVLYVVYRLTIKQTVSFQDIFIARPSIHIGWSVLALICYVIFYYYAVKSLKINWLSIGRYYMEKHRFLLLIAGLVVFVFLYYFPTVHGYQGPFSLVNELAQICQFPATDVLIFLETHFLYLGLGFALMIVFWKEICDGVRKKGFGFYLVTLLSLLFLADIETRKVICFYLLLLIPMMNYVDNLKISGKMVSFIVFWQLAASFFWFPVNVSGINAYFETYQVDVYMQWPSQRYYMFQGPWQSHEIYLMTMAVEMIAILCLYRWKCHQSSESID